MAKKICILSIDGGGIRGIIPGVILAHLEKKLAKAHPGSRLHDYFDLFAGTSTGGILTCAYLTPNTSGMGSKFSAEEAVELYFKHGGEIFDQSIAQKIKSLGGLTEEKYSSEAMERIFSRYFGSAKLSELLRPCLVTAYDIFNRQAFFFTQHDAEEKVRNYLVKDVAKATAAAPTYFEVVATHSILGDVRPLIDGGVFANNPAMCAYAEARNIDFSKEFDGKTINKPCAEDMFLVSVGTGSVKKQYPFEKARKWGTVEWIKPLIDIMMSGNAETVDYQLKKIFETTPVPNDYIRLSPDLDHANPEMDDASEENMENLRRAGLKYVADHQTTLDRIVRRLLENRETAKQES